MSSTSRDFSVKEICSILEKCQETGVHEFTLGTLRVTFSGQKTYTPEEIAPVYEAPDLSPSPKPREPLETKPAFDREAYLELLAIEDPQEFERLKALGDTDEGS
jgi:hypothetical protein